MDRRVNEAECRERMAAARVARLATAGSDGRPHLVPITFALAGNRLVTAVDHKPKSTTRLRRLRNIRENPAVSVLCDHYDEDWTRLWWVRVDGTAEVIASDNDLVDALVAKYPQYAPYRPKGPLIVITPTHWSGWRS
jgi:PPOX class probable F420-dependent enzyme